MAFHVPISFAHCSGVSTLKGACMNQREGEGERERGRRREEQKEEEKKRGGEGEIVGRRAEREEYRMNKQLKLYV